MTNQKKGRREYVGAVRTDDGTKLYFVQPVGSFINMSIRSKSKERKPLNMHWSFNSYGRISRVYLFVADFDAQKRLITPQLDILKSEEKNNPWESGTFTYAPPSEYVLEAVPDLKEMGNLEDQLSHLLMTGHEHATILLDGFGQRKILNPLFSLKEERGQESLVNMVNDCEIMGLLQKAKDLIPNLEGLSEQDGKKIARVSYMENPEKQYA